MFLRNMRAISCSIVPRDKKYGQILFNATLFGLPPEITTSGQMIQTMWRLWFGHCRMDGSLLMTIWCVTIKKTSVRTENKSAEQHPFFLICAIWAILPQNGLSFVFSLFGKVTERLQWSRAGLVIGSLCVVHVALSWQGLKQVCYRNVEYRQNKF